MNESNNNIKQNRRIYSRLVILIVWSLTSTQRPSIEECGIHFSHNQLFLLQERIALPDSEKGHALSLGFSYDILQETKGLFQIFILPSNFQPFRAITHGQLCLESRNRFLAVYSCYLHPENCKRILSKINIHEGSKERIIVPPNTQRIKSPGFQIAVTSYFNSMMSIYSSYLASSRS